MTTLFVAVKDRSPKRSNARKFPTVVSKAAAFAFDANGH